MSKSAYTVPFVKRELLHLWRDFWDSGAPSAEAKQMNRDGSLSRSEIVEAKNKQEAADIIERRYPDCIVIRDAVGRIGS